METIDASGLRELAELRQSPCVSLYLNTWVKEIDARERARLFVQQRFRRALRAADDPGVRADLERVQRKAEAILAEGGPPAVAIFACGSVDLFRVVELDVPVEDELVVGDGPALRQLARLSEDYEKALLVLVNAENARIYELTLGRLHDERAVPGEKINKKRSDAKSDFWSDLHYQRHVQEHIDRHLREVAMRAVHLVDEIHPHMVLVGGTQPTVDRFMHELPPRVRTKVTDVVALAPDSPLADVVDAAMKALEEEARKSEIDGVKETVGLALADGPAALGIDEVIAAARQGKLMTVYLSGDFKASGKRCRDCGALDRQVRAACAYCDGELSDVELGEALVREAITQDGTVDFVPNSALLKRHEGVVAKLRW